MSRRELQSGQHLPGLLGCSAVQLNNANTGIVEQKIDGRVVSDTAADFRQHGRWHPNERSLLVSHSQDCSSALREQRSRLPSQSSEYQPVFRPSCLSPPTSET
jgi:hypothetical protein